MNFRFLLGSFLFACIIIGTIYSQPKLPSKREMLKQLKARLELTDVQTKKIDVILSASEKKLHSLRDEMDEQHEKKMDQMDSVLSSRESEIEKVLTDTQKKEYKEMKKEMEKIRPSKGDRPEPPKDGHPKPPEDSQYE